MSSNFYTAIDAPTNSRPSRRSQTQKLHLQKHLDNFTPADEAGASYEHSQTQLIKHLPAPSPTTMVLTMISTQPSRNTAISDMTNNGFPILPSLLKRSTLLS